MNGSACVVKHIGLSISRSIVDHLWAENNPGFGAKVSLLLSAPGPTTTGD
jgi:hypothetical protein